jgi:hypothetical protein
MALRRVTQLNYTGCFIASVAMLLNKSYAEAFALLHPGMDMDQSYEHGFRELASMEEIAHKHLQRLGFRTRTCKYRRFSSYRNRVQKNAILIIRWTYSPTLCHCIVFDAELKKFFDPNEGTYVESNHSIKRLQRQLDCGIVIEHTPVIEAPHDLHRSPPDNTGAWGEGLVGQNLLHPNR